MAFVKEVQLGDKVYGLKFSAYTYILYKNFFGTDFMQDLQKYANEKKNLKQILEKIEEKGIESVSRKDIDRVLEATTNADIFVRFGVACIATYKYPMQVAPEKIIDSLPPSVFYNGEMTRAISDLLTEAVTDIRRNVEPFNLKKKR